MRPKHERSGRTEAIAPPSLIAVLAGIASAPQSHAQTDPVEEVVVIAPYAATLPVDRAPITFQSATAEDIEASHALDLTDFLNRRFGSVTINHAQNNPLQPDLNFRGFTASPLLGLAPGLSVFQNGVRLNEPFGDTVNWDLIPLSAVNTVQLAAGANPVFGLNTLGGALVLQTKNGFSYERAQAQVHGGSFGRRMGAFEYGTNDGRWGYYANVEYFDEDGWREHSASDALRLLGAVSLRTEATSIDATATYAATELRGNGAAPIELLELDREQVFTHPDLTENELAQVTLEAAQQTSENFRIAGNAFYRKLVTEAFNGDGTIFEECDDGDGEEELLVEEDFEDLNGDGECSLADDAASVVLDTLGDPIEAELDGEELDAINNRGRRDQTFYGASLQFGGKSQFAGRDHHVMLGAAYSEGSTDFGSTIEVARLLEDRSTLGIDVFASEFGTRVGSDVASASAYFASTLDVSEALALTIAGRYNHIRVRLADRSGRTPELNGSHVFERFNPSAGFTLQLTSSATLFASYGQSARAPTPVELACASEDAPCSLPNSFLADPPLEQVVATNLEAGVRGGIEPGLNWRLSAFRTSNADDILFQTTGGAQANVGFFDNVGDTRRQGLELGLTQDLARLSWSLQYSFVEASFENAFVTNSPNHPIFDADPSAAVIAGPGKLQVRRGDEIPGIPRHQVNVGLDYELTDRLSTGADVQYRSGVRLRGDEANLLARTDAATILNLRLEYRLHEHAAAFVRVENALDEEYETFGLLGEPDEVFEDFEDPRFLGAGPTRGVWVGVRITF